MKSDLYSTIYNDLYSTNEAYSKAQFSPGYRIALEHTDVIRASGKVHLDVGCGVGFVVGLLGSIFKKDSYGVDVSQVAIELAKQTIPASNLKLISDGIIPFPDDYFDLVTCFDVIEHLNQDDIIFLTKELKRVINPNGTLILNISTRAAKSFDKFGENLHRTVQDADYYAQLFKLDRYTINTVEQELTAYRQGKW